MISVFLLGYLSVVTAKYSDNLCICADTKTNSTTPLAPSNIEIGCSEKLGMNNTIVFWCLTDQSNGTCGLYDTRYGWSDTCTNTLTAAEPFNITIPIIAGVCGIVIVCIGIAVGYHKYETNRQTQKRLMKRAHTTRYIQETQMKYLPQSEQIVMYTRVLPRGQ